MVRGPLFGAALCSFGLGSATYPDGRSSETVVTPGETLYRKTFSHAIENIGDTEVHALLVELEPGSR